jgi:4-diphosphocytidyl-2-C-methyl-D-erythritol kinase
MAVTLTAAAPGKINLSLFLGPTRPDGRHELVTVFESVSLFDTLALSVTGDGDEVRCPGVSGPNLVAGALAGLRARGWAAPPVLVEIDKRIPIAAGLAGGSADAAATLRLARALGEGDPRWHVEEAWLWELAAELGADVPSQLVPGVSLGLGAGERVEQAAPPAAHALVIVPLPAALSTPEVFREADRLGLPRDAEDLAGRLDELSGRLRHGARLPARLLVNDLEPAARSLCPLTGDALDGLREVGADAALVCGSGPTCAGLWWGEEALIAAREAARSLSSRFPLSAAVTPVGADAGSVSRGIRHNKNADE